MALQTSGAISLANVQTEFGGVNPISISEYYGKAAGIPASGAISLSHFYGKSNGVLTLKEVVFNASGTFTMPSGVVDNQIIVGCTGGGGGGNENEEYTYGGNGAGRVVSTITMSPGQTATVTVGAGGLRNHSHGGTSSFTGASSCDGGTLGGYYYIAPTNGGGSGNSMNRNSTASNCPATLSLKNGAVDSTTGLWKAKSFSGGNYYGQGGGGGCYGIGSTYSFYSSSPEANSGAGGYNLHGGSGKVVVWYYTYV